ncbi:ABC transporter permease [Neoasaia chiangmaiensis NBRC 101099]|uniref:ABC transporter permease n=1 Tax=Neoasaia chiangmaiensis TaxID=320497 RepID=A0A1U9KMZ3_9PROT|nr:ABC transporter permease [Neoasaia chiangmaiensis]AQS87174.1 ABC transporter permease [Neoasaia chiangmaiensis]GBR38228.1 ABC transporter permease [Neoasaia chiangmaiensis NBRC 101099]GEN15980.1 hypothetical protein NCH01_24110 [Neoasaia chiangmaiensis]
MSAIAAGGRDFLRWLGGATRRQLRFTLMLVGAGWGVLKEAARPNSWRRTVRLEFREALRQATGGGLISTLFVAALTGFGIVAQAVYWLNIVGMAQTTDSLLATVLVREIAPVLVGVILLGRTGMLGLTQTGMLTLGGQMRALQSEGIDPFLMFVMPRTLAMTVSSFSLGILFSAVSLSVGYIVCWVESIETMPIWTFLYDVVCAMDPIDYLGIPLKFLFSGFFVSLSCCLTGMDATQDDSVATLLPRGFARGILVLMIINVALTVGVA